MVSLIGKQFAFIEIIEFIAQFKKNKVARNIKEYCEFSSGFFHSPITYTVFLTPKFNESANQIRLKFVISRMLEIHGYAVGKNPLISCNVTNESNHRPYLCRKVLIKKKPAEAGFQIKRCRLYF